VDEVSLDACMARMRIFTNVSVFAALLPRHLRQVPWNFTHDDAEFSDFKWLHPRVAAPLVRSLSFKMLTSRGDCCTIKTLVKVLCVFSKIRQIPAFVTDFAD
jgi:hypothetical protein